MSLIASDFDIRGLRELSDELINLEDKMRKQFIVRASRAGAKVFLALERQYVPKETGALEKALIIKVRTNAKYRQFGQISTVIMPRRIEGEDNQTPGAYGLMVAVGTKAHKIVPKNKKALAIRIRGSFTMNGRIIVASVEHPGAKPKPYVQRAFESGRDPAFAAFAAQMNKDLEGYRARS